MQLVIAEKPSVARDLARVLGVRGAGKHAIGDGKRVITWCIGHLVELEEPVAYDTRWKAWRLDTLPMIPSSFKLRPVAGTRDQLRAVRELLRDRRFSEVVNACDAGREGELIFRYVYELAGARLPVRRLWISSMTDEAIGRGFAALRSGRDYDALGDAARCRSEADWLVGMNATRAVTVARRFEGAGGGGGDAGGEGRANAAAPIRSTNRAASGSGEAARPWRRGRGGKGGRPTNHGAPLYSIGRVQTPTLALVVTRERAITNFRPQDYWEVRGTFRMAGGKASQGRNDGDGTGGGRASSPIAFTAGWSTPSPTGKGTATRFGRAELADEVLARASARARATDLDGPVVEKVNARKSHEPPPQLFDLTSLQRTANRRWGMSATRTLEAAQALYERHKLLTYPRTDSRHLSSDLFDEMPKLFRGLAQIADYAPFAGRLLEAPPPRSKRVFDDAKVSDHHAIIPTGKTEGKTGRPDALELDERRIYDLVVRRFLGAFFPDAEFALTEVVVRVGAPGPARAPAGDSAGAVMPDEALLTAVPPPPDRFTARGRVRLVAGWQEVAQLGEGAAPSDGPAGGPGRGARAGAGATPADRDAETDAEPGSTLPSILPPLTEGQRLDGSFERVAKQTKPPPRHTEATLLGAMEYAGRTIEDEQLRAAMKDTGLGTPATRAATIETLVRRQFLGRQGKQLIPTALGIGLVEGLPVASLASPELTGAWEARLARIARGQDTRAAFMHDIARYVGEVVDAIRRGGPPREPSQPAAPARAGELSSHPPPAAGPRRRAAAPAPPPPTAPATATAPTPLVCPRCKQGNLITGKRGWGCERWREGCSFVIWFETAGRRLTDVQLRDLVSKGKTRKATWRPAGGPPDGTAGRLVLDVEAAPPAGGARFEPG